MKNKNQFENKEKPLTPEIETGWEELTHMQFEQPKYEESEKVDFRDLNSATNKVRGEIRRICIEMSENYSELQLNAEAFFMILLGKIQTPIAMSSLKNVYEDYEFWKEVLGELRPIISGYWVGCDFLVLHYLFEIFVSQFLVILELWEKVRFSRAYMKDCAALGEFYIDINALQNDMLQNTISNWGVGSL